MIDTNAISCMIWKNFVLEALELWIDESKGCGDFEDSLKGWDDSVGGSVGLNCFGESVLQIRVCYCLIPWGTRLDVQMQNVAVSRVVLWFVCSFNLLIVVPGKKCTMVPCVCDGW